MALLFKAQVFRQNARHHPCNGIHQHQRRQLAAGEDIVPDGDLLVHDLVQDALVYTFIMPAKHENMRHHGQFQRALLFQHLFLGGHIDHIGLCADIPADRLIAAVDGVCLHDHASAAAVRHIIHTAVLVQGIVPDIPAADRDMPGFSGSADDALGQHRLTHFRKQGSDLNLHRTSPPADECALRRRPGRSPAPHPGSPGSARSFRPHL